jgi:hypothetical protein
MAKTVDAPVNSSRDVVLEAGDGEQVIELALNDARRRGSVFVFGQDK